MRRVFFVRCRGARKSDCVYIASVVQECLGEHIYRRRECRSKPDAEATRKIQQQTFIKEEIGAHAIFSKIPALEINRFQCTA
jgi:hypothetical protein